LEGVAVSIGSKTATSDELGVFRINGATVKDNLGYVKAELTGYFPGSRSFLPTDGINNVNIRMLTKQDAGSVDASTGGMVQSEGVEIEFTAGGFMQGGNTYTGDVNVAMNFIDPESDNFDEEMPGALLGVQDGNGQVLTSFGMVAAELTDNAGTKIDLATGTTAEVRFPVPASMLSAAPTEIDLWYFDENSGYWVSEGKATLVGSEYVGQVGHFSFWNCDVPNDFIYLDGQVVDGSGNGMQGAKVTITSGSFGSSSTSTDSEGSFGGYVPNDETLTITVKALCEGVLTQVYNADVGPYSSNTTLDIITATLPNSTEVTGTVEDCDGNAPASGYVTANGAIYYLSNGNFSIPTCGDNTTLTAYNTSDGWEAGTPQNISLSGGTQNVGTLTACDGAQTGSVTDIDGNTYNTVVIGTQEWMAENLRTTKYQNGDAIPNVTEGNEWVYLTTGAFCWYDNDNQHENIYGKLYNWYAVADNRNICPTGWHMPIDAEWTVLTDYLGGDIIAGGKMKEVGTTHWSSPNEGATNSSGFSGLPGGYRNYNGNFTSLGFSGNWWSATEDDASTAWYRYLDYYLANVFRFYNGKEDGLSCRCVRD
ncbi:MAG: hypothetical protein GY746_12865, partial [Gammaproteobacteria bacterium]|nr:hypothetical protein [Gammaproteobacteria bacterium]